MSHHASPTIMQMRLPNGTLETTGAENASVFYPHFDMVFNNHRLIYLPVIYRIKQIDLMEEPDTPILWDNIKKFTTKLANDKVQVLNGVPTNAFKALNDKNITWIVLFYNRLCLSQTEFGIWHYIQVVSVPIKRLHL